MPGEASSAAASCENAVRPNSSRLAASAAAPTALANERSRFDSEDIGPPVPDTLFQGSRQGPKPDAKVSQGILDQFWLRSMQCGLKNAYAEPALGAFGVAVLDGHQLLRPVRAHSHHHQRREAILLEPD